MVVLAAFGCGIASCDVTEVDSVPVRWLDYPEFEAQVQPILAERCGNPTCHGRPERPFSVFSPLAWRLDAARTYLQEPLTEEELVHNYVSACVFASEADAPADAALVRKPLADTIGVYHGGGVIFDGRADRNYRAVHAWLENGWDD
jgi:hypothetical protein